jgi:hypothetical protein
MFQTPYTNDILVYKREEVSMKTFNAKVKRLSGRAGLYIEIPFDCEKAFASKDKIKVKGTINGQNIKTVLIPDSSGKHLINLTRGMRVKANIHSDEDELRIVLKKDDTHDHIHIPADLLAAIKNDSETAKFFNSLDLAHRRQFVKWIEEPKRAETRKARLSKVIEKLSKGQKLK